MSRLLMLLGKGRTPRAAFSGPSSTGWWAQSSWFYSPLTEGLDFDSHDEKANTCTWLLSAAALTKLGFENWPQEPKRCCQSRFFDVFFDGPLSPVGYTVYC